MKLSQRLIGPGLLALTVMLFWLGARHPAVRPPVPVAPVAAPPPPAARLAAEASDSILHQSYWRKQSSDPLDHTLALLRWKLRQWHDSEINDPDAETERDQLLHEMLALVTDENVAEVMQSLSAQELDTPFGCGALHHWLQTDPATATGWLAARPDATAVQTLTLADYWSSHSDALPALVGSLPDTVATQNFLQQTSEELSRTDPAAAAQLAQQMKPGAAQTNLLQTVAGNWIGTDPTAAVNWITSVTDPALRDRLIASAAQAYALTDPAQAANWLVSSVQSDEVASSAAFDILKTWVTQDPAQAAGWVAQFPAGDLQAHAVQIVAQYWQQTNPNAATAWMQNLAGVQSAPAN